MATQVGLQYTEFWDAVGGRGGGGSPCINVAGYPFSDIAEGFIKYWQQATGQDSWHCVAHAVGHKDVSKWPGTGTSGPFSME